MRLCLVAKTGANCRFAPRAGSEEVALLSETRSANDARGAKREVKTKKGVEDDERRWGRIK